MQLLKFLFRLSLFLFSIVCSAQQLPPIVKYSKDIYNA